METENKVPEEENDKKSEVEKSAERADQTPDEPKTETSAENAQAETAEETPSEASEEKTGESTPEEPEAVSVVESEQSEGTPETATDVDYKAENEQLKSENTRLKAQLEAHNAGFRGEYIEDAVLIAENAANRDGITITEALQAVAKKYPEWKHTADDKGRSGFKVGADSPKEDKTAEDEQLNEAFGIRRKK